MLARLFPLEITLTLQFVSVLYSPVIDNVICGQEICQNFVSVLSKEDKLACCPGLQLYKPGILTFSTMLTYFYVHHE